MKICDRTNNREGVTKIAGHELRLDVEIFHLCQTEFDLVRDFILNPKDWRHVNEIQDAVSSAPLKRKRGRPSKADLERRRQQESQGLSS